MASQYKPVQADDMRILQLALCFCGETGQTMADWVYSLSAHIKSIYTAGQLYG